MYMHIYKHYMYVQLRTEWTDVFLYYRWNIETCYLITLKLNGFLTHDNLVVCEFRELIECEIIEKSVMGPTFTQVDFP